MRCLLSRLSRQIQTDSGLHEDRSRVRGPNLLIAMPVEEEPLKGALGRISFDRINRHFITVPKHVGRDGVEGVEGYSDGPCGMWSHLEAYLIHTERLDQEWLVVRREQPVPGTQGFPYGISDTRHRDVFPFDR